MPCACQCCCGCCCDGDTGSQTTAAQCVAPKEYLGNGSSCAACCDLGEIREDIDSEEDCPGEWVADARCGGCGCPPERVCGDACCDEGQTCVDGQCVGCPGTTCDPNVPSDCATPGCACCGGNCVRDCGGWVGFVFVNQPTDDPAVCSGTPVPQNNACGPGCAPLVNVVLGPCTPFPQFAFGCCVEM